MFGEVVVLNTLSHRLKKRELTESNLKSQKNIEILSYYTYDTAL